MNTRNREQHARHARHVTNTARHREYDRLDAEATRLVREGKTDEEIARLLGISVDEAWVFTIRKR